MQKKISKIFKLDGSKTAGDVIEETLLIGSDHLTLNNFSWWEENAIDVHIVCISLISFILWLDWKILKWIYRRCCSKKEKKD